MIGLDPLNEDLAISEKEGRKELQQAILLEENFLKQKARVKWLNLGDKNNRFFHHSIQSPQYKNSFNSIKNSQGDTLTEPQEIKKEAEQFFRLLFAPHLRMELHDADIQNVQIKRTLSHEQKNTFIQPISVEEIRRTVFAMDGSKAPGPDGFNANFFRSCWPIVGEEVTNAIQSFFVNPYMPRDVNSTFLCLIPKVESPKTFGEFRPIALCNVIYKIVSKILANRLQLCISSLVAGNQSAFIKGRSIVDNILLCHDIVKGIDRRSSPPIAVMKVDLHKAYDSINRR